jgi:hypothetical protein
MLFYISLLTTMKSSHHFWDSVPTLLVNTLIEKGEGKFRKYTVVVLVQSKDTRKSPCKFTLNQNHNGPFLSVMEGLLQAKTMDRKIFAT